ncbi:MAG: cyclase family protein, partial [Gemmatimonadales bacterium]
APFQTYPNGLDLSVLPLESLADLYCLVVRTGEGKKGEGRKGERAIDSLPFPDAEVGGKAVLFHTGWDRRWRTDRYFEGHPYLSGALAQRLADAGAVLVGIDSYNIDCTDDGNRPVHSTLLSREIPIAEHLTNLAAVPERGSRFFAVPVKVKGFGTFPVRAFVLD